MKYLTIILLLTIGKLAAANELPEKKDLITTYKGNVNGYSIFEFENSKYFCVTFGNNSLQCKFKDEREQKNYKPSTESSKEEILKKLTPEERKALGF
jgi:hypothetical protein